jgi:hypothetical protein
MLFDDFICMLYVLKMGNATQECEIWASTWDKARSWTAESWKELHKELEPERLQAIKVSGCCSIEIVDASGNCSQENLSPIPSQALTPQARRMGFAQSLSFYARQHPNTVIHG